MAAFDGHLVDDLFSQGLWGGAWPPQSPGSTTDFAQFSRFFFEKWKKCQTQTPVVVHLDMSGCNLLSPTLDLRSILSGGSKGGARDTRPPGGPNSFNFMQFSGNFGKMVCWRPPGGPNSFNFMQFLGKFGKIVCWRPLLRETLDPPLILHTDPLWIFQSSSPTQIHNAILFIDTSIMLYKTMLIL